MKSPLDRPHSKFYNQLEFTPKNYALNVAAEAVFMRLEVHGDGM